MKNLAVMKPPARDTNIQIIFDADSLLYMAGFVTQYKEEKPNTTLVTREDGTELWVEPESHVHHVIRGEINKVCNLFRSDNVQLHLTEGGGFRKEIATIKPYKGNRKSPRPYHYDTALEYTVSNYRHDVQRRYEADDICCMDQEAFIAVGWPSVMVHIDKDLNMMPGWHYNPTKEKLYFVTEEQGVRNFFRQLMTGDAVDNIGGIPGVGPKGAEKVLDVYLEDVFGMITSPMKCEALGINLKHDVLELYQQAFDKGKFPDHIVTASDAMLENARLLWMIREPGTMWDFDTTYSVPWFNNCANIQEILNEQ